MIDSGGSGSEETFAGRQTPSLATRLLSSLRLEAEREGLLRLICWNRLPPPRYGLSPRIPVVTMHRIVRRWAWLSSSSSDELKTIFPLD